MDKNNVIDLDDHRKQDLWIVFALCLDCLHRWIGGVPIEVSLFQLECPECKGGTSFASIMPQEYQDDLKNLRERNEPKPEQESGNIEGPRDPLA